MKSLFISVMVVAIAVAAAFVVMGIQSRAGKVPGLVDGKLTPCADKPNCVSSMMPASDSHYVAGFEFPPGEADQFWAEMTNAIVELGGVLNENAPPYLAATFTSNLFGFVDDFECLINNQSGKLQVRSGARVGYSDLDVNRNRVESLRQLLQAAD